jgi:hypothetical protein
MDEIDLFPRTPDGPNPFLLLDGHGSRFELPFMEYINQPETMWCVCIGVPYGTSYWQVGDSPEQNGCFKMKNTEAKEILVAWKGSRGWAVTIEKTDIVPVVKYGWERSFARTRTNKTAIAVRGWNPLNRALLEHPEIVDTQMETAEIQPMSQASSPDSVSQSTLTETTVTTTSLPDINTTDGTSGEMFAILLRNADKDELRRRRKQQNEAGQEMVQQVEKVKRLTAGVHFNSKEVRIGETALQRVRAQHEKRQAEQLKKDGKKTDEQRERRRKAMEVRDLNRPEEQWNKAHFKAMCLYKKVPGDKGLPESLPLLQQLWNERKGRLSPPVSPDHSDDESDDEPIVALNSPADVSTLSDITNTPPMRAPESEERVAVANSEQGTMPRLEL